jgi:hypothetical protein
MTEKLKKIDSQLLTPNTEAAEEVVQDILNEFPDLGNTTMYQGSTKLIDETGHYELTEDYELSGFQLKDGAIFKEGNTHTFDIEMKGETVKAGDEIPLNKLVSIPSGDSVSLSQELRIPKKHLLKNDKPFINPFNKTLRIRDESVRGNVKDIKPGDEVPANAVFSHHGERLKPGETEVTGSFINYFENLALNQDISSTVSLEANDILEGPFACDKDIEVRYENGNVKTINLQNPLKAGEIVKLTKPVSITQGTVIKDGSKLPFNVVQASTLNFTKQTILPSGTTLLNQKPEFSISIKNIQSIKDLVEMDEDDIKEEKNPESLFRKMFLSNIKTTIYKEDKYNDLIDVYNRIDSNAGNDPEQVRLVKSLLAFRLLNSIKTYIKDLPKPDQINLNNLNLFIDSLNTQIESIKKKRENKTKNIDTDPNLGNYIEKNASLLGSLKNKDELDSKISNEVLATTQNASLAVARTLDSKMAIKNTKEENQEMFKKFTSETAQEALSQGYDVYLSRLGEVYNGAIDERVGYLNNSNVFGGFQKLVAWNNRQRFMKKVLITGGIALFGSTLAATNLVSVGAAALLTKGYISISASKMMKRLGRWTRTSKVSSPHSAIASQMDYHLRSIPDKDGASQAETSDILQRNQSSIRENMDKYFKEKITSVEYKAKLKTLKDNVENAETPEDSAEAIKNLKSVYNTIIMEILEGYYQDQLESIVNARKLRNLTRVAEYSSTFALLTFAVPAMIKGAPEAAEWVSEKAGKAWDSFKAPEVGWSTDRFIDAIYKANPFNGEWGVASDASAANIPDGGSTLDLDKITPSPDVQEVAEADREIPNTPNKPTPEIAGDAAEVSGNNVNNIISSAKSNIHEAVNSGIIESNTSMHEAAHASSQSNLPGSAQDISFKIPSDSLSVKLYGDVDPGLSQIFEGLTEKEIDSTKMQSLKELVQKANPSISNIDRIYNGDKFSLSKDLISKLMEETGASYETIVKNAKKLS